MPAVELPKQRPLARVRTGLPRLDAILGGGLPAGSMTIVAGRPGVGKTVLAQQICFYHGTPDARVLFFSVLSEPTAKTLRHVGQFAFFDAARLDEGIEFIDLREVARTGGLDGAVAHIMGHVARVGPRLVVIDGFRAFDELARSPEDVRDLGYEIAVRLMVWECTSLLLDGYRPGDLATRSLFSVVDGVILLSDDGSSGRPRRFLRVVKMRGTAHSRERHAFEIGPAGIDIAPAPV